MKTTLTLLTLVLATQTAFAANLGSQCGLLDGFDSDSFEEVGTSLDVVDGGTFTALEKKQIIAGAQSLARESSETVKPTLKASIAYLNESSEGGDVYLQTNLVNGKEVTVLLYYPGGNPVGVIFEKGTLHEIAHIEDSDVVCVAPKAEK